MHESIADLYGNVRVIQLGELAVLQGRNLIAMGFLVERRAGHGSGFPDIDHIRSSNGSVNYKTHEAEAEAVLWLRF